MAPAHADRGRLEGFVAACLIRAEALARSERRIFLRRNAAHVEARLRALSAWAERAGEGPAPPDLAGLSAFDLSDAMDRLNAATPP